MKKFKLPRTAKAAIKAWLELPDHFDPDMAAVPKDGTCPFGGVLNVFERPRIELPCLEICARMFPSLGLTRHCPCNTLTLNYVIRRAKEVIR